MSHSSILFIWLLCLQVFFVGSNHLMGQEKSESENNEEESSLEVGGAEDTGGQNETSTVETGTGALSPEQPDTEPIPTTTSAPVKGSFAPSERPVGKGVAGLSQVIRRQAPSIDVSSIRSVILEATPEIQLSKKIGKVDKNSRAVLALNLSDEQIQRFYELTKSVQESLLKQEQSTARRLLSIEGLATKHGKIFFSYNTSTRNLILQLDNKVMLQLLDEGFDQELLSEALTKMNILASRDNNQPTKPKVNELDLRALALSDRLRESGNSEVMDILYDLSGSDLTEEWIRVGEVSDILLRDYDLGKSLPSSALASTDVFGNPFFDVANALFEELKLDELINGENSSVLAGKNLIVRENAEFLNSFFSTAASDLVLVSGEELWIQKDFAPQFEEGSNKRVVIMGGESLKVTPNIQIGSALSDLLISTNSDLLLRSTTMEAARELVIRGYRDVTINNSSISAQTLAMIKARRDLTIDGLAFKRDVSRIIMEATTMRLSNIDFPALSQVRLNTLKGGVDGRYPNFGRQIPSAQQIGRVNFIENVRSGGNLMNDRPSFDLHGKNIEIGKLARP